EIVQKCFADQYAVEHQTSREGALERFQTRRYEYTFMDIELLRTGVLEHDYKTALQPFWRLYATADIIILTTQELIREAVKAVKVGASNYLTYPLNPDEVKYVVDSLSEFTRFQGELDYLRSRFWRSESHDILRTNSSLMKAVFEKVQAVAQTESSVLLTGETGTGKGVIAKLIHQHSNRSRNQYISVHCGAIPDSLLESELFGHEKGAFTGAVRRKLGKFEIARGGTILLDEIGTISSTMQIKLLQILQDKTFSRVGGEEVIEADVRIIAATNTVLKTMSERGEFRRDLYYRLNVFPIEIPPLRERIEDISLLVEIFLKRLNKFHSRNLVDIHPDVLRAFQRYSWPGNIRELENLIERASILETSSVLTPNSFPMELFIDQVTKPNNLVDTSKPLHEVRREGIERLERQYLRELLKKHNGRISATADAAGISVRQLHKLMTRYDLQKKDFKIRPGVLNESEH
ncbi:MAG TPA: sigma-54 dependent transcriptional regulator, partial [bacterium]